MSTINREQIFQEVTEFIDCCAGSAYNVADLLLSPLYMHAIQPASVVVPSLKKRVARIMFRVIGFFRSRITFRKQVDIIFWPVEYSHIRQMEAVYRNLNTLGFQCMWVTNRKKIVVQLKKQNHKAVYVPDSFTLDFMLMKRIRKSVTTTLPSQKFNDIIKMHLPVLASLIKLNETIIARFNPKALLVGNDLTVEGRVASTIFKNNGIFTCCIQHGDMSHPLHTKHVVDSFFLYGTKSLKEIAKYDASARFSVTGAPYLENSWKSDDELLNDWPGMFSPCILVALSGPGNNTSYAHHQMLAEAVFKLAHELKDIHIVVKLHPKDRLENYPQREGQYESDRIRIVPYSPDSSIFSWLHKCDILITGASTTAIEAMHVSKPVITLDFMNEYKGFSFIDECATMHVNDYSALKEAVQLLLSDDRERNARIEKGRAFATDYYLSGAEHPSARIADAILEGMQMSGKVKVGSGRKLVRS